MDEIIEKLENIFEDVTDITDPASMDKVLAIVEQSRVEDDEYIQLLVKKLEGKEISWERPPYQMSRCITLKPPLEEAELCASGHFTKAEGELVKKNWDRFVRQYDVPNTPICFARWKNRTRSKLQSPEECVRRYVIAYLAQGLHRNLYQVNTYFLKTYSYPVKLRSYTPTEQKIMKICFYHRPQDARVLLPEVLGRDKRGIHKQYKEYFNGKENPRKKIKWTLKLAAKVLNHLMNHSGGRFKRLKYKEFDQQVWQELGEEMGQLYRHVREFWIGKLHVQLFAKCTIKLKSLRKIIFNKLKNSSYEIWSDIRWKELAKEFPDGFTDLFLYKVAKEALRGRAGYRGRALRDLAQQTVELNKKKKQNRRLKSLKYHKSNGTLTFIQHDISVKQLIKKESIVD